LYPLFRAANVSHSSTLTEQELGSALVNGDYTSFHPRTVKMMIKMFDRDGSGTINFDEFVSLWRYLAAWRELFDRFDEDRSGRISLPEFENALVAFGYRHSPKFVAVIFGVFESKTKQMGVSPKDPSRNGMSFDLFVQACISLKRMTDVFKRYDEDRDGYITVSFEEFLTGKFFEYGFVWFGYEWIADLVSLRNSSITGLMHSGAAIICLVLICWSSRCRICLLYPPIPPCCFGHRVILKNTLVIAYHPGVIEL
jgi:Ca2+-binding EF-hand superfamily protein